MSDTLRKICARTLEDLALREAGIALSEMKERAKDSSAPRGFMRALREKAVSGVPALIAEVKKASPSKGLIRADFDPVVIAKAYESAGAACLSVLTDAPFFQGAESYLVAARAAVSLPVLRKDFMLTPYQIYESRALGADCILLIVAALEDAQMTDLYALSKDLGMDVLVEVHDAEELERAKALAPEMLGVNNRNLKTLVVDIDTSRKLAADIPQSCLKVAESGIGSYADIKDFQSHGYGAFLVGESLMRQENITAATQKLLGLS